MSVQQDGMAVDASDPADDFMLAGWVVSPSLNRVTQNGTSIHLRPQLMDVLVCLARHAGRTVPRDVLLDRVWARQFVADTSLARCVAELRQALGDNARTPTVIETIPKRGYRLIAAVGPAPTNGHGASPPLAGDHARAAGAGGHGGGELVTPGATEPGGPAGTADTGMAGTRTEAAAPARWPQWWALAVSVAALLTVVWLIASAAGNGG